MRASLMLGLRLAGRNAGNGRLRALSALLVSLAGAALLVVVLSLLQAGRPRVLVPGVATADVIGQILPGIVAIAIALPVLAAAAATGRMSERIVARRRARLHLLGLRRRDQVLIGVGESLPVALLGAGLGIGAGVLLVPWTGQMLLGITNPASATAGAIIAALAVPLCVVAGAAVPTGAPGGSSIERARGEVPRRPGLWRAAVLLAGLVMLVLSWSAPLSSNATITVLFLGGAALAALGSVLLPALVVRRLADALVRIGRPVTVVAGRRLQVQPAALGRVLGALMIGVVVTTAAQGLISTITSQSLYQAGRYYRDVEAVAQASLETPDDLARLETALADVDGVRTMSLTASGHVVSPGGTPEEFSVRAIVTSCAQLDPQVTGCRDDRAAWIPSAHPGAAPEVIPTGDRLEVRRLGDPVPGRTTQGEEPAPALTVTVATDPLVTAAEVPTWQRWDGGTTLFVPRGLVSDAQFWQLGWVTATVTADPRPDLPAELRAVGINAHIGWPAEDFAPLQSTIDTIRLLNLVVLAVGLGAFLLGTADLALARRAEHTRLRLLGMPVALLRRAHWLEVSLPLLLGTAAALGIGFLVAASFVEVGNRGQEAELISHLPLSVLEGPVLATAGGAIVIALLTGIGIGAPLRSDHIRQA